ncbi:MAG: hypothetical protein LBK60_00220 [Verrucomicrobiales bacterium]|jgi:hypothetical protein|nr:hypothetical protein [Verrucomicrobiales bacterium]
MTSLTAKLTGALTAPLTARLTGWGKAAKRLGQWIEYDYGGINNGLAGDSNDYNLVIFQGNKADSKPVLLNRATGAQTIVNSISATGNDSQAGLLHNGVLYWVNWRDAPYLLQTYIIATGQYFTHNIGGRSFMLRYNPNDNCIYSFSRDSNQYCYFTPPAQITENNDIQPTQVSANYPMVDNVIVTNQGLFAKYGGYLSMWSTTNKSNYYSGVNPGGMVVGTSWLLSDTPNRRNIVFNATTNTTWMRYTTDNPTNKAYTQADISYRGILGSGGKTLKIGDSFFFPCHGRLLATRDIAEVEGFPPLTAHPIAEVGNNSTTHTTIDGRHWLITANAIYEVFYTPADGLHIEPRLTMSAPAGGNEVPVKIGDSFTNANGCVYYYQP